LRKEKNCCCASISSQRGEGKEAEMGDKEKLDELTGRSYKDQACWFLNAYWEQFGQKESEKVWAFVKKCGELDETKRSEGCDLDEFKAHRFLEHFHETLTVQAMRDRLRSSGAIIGQIKRVPLLHILIIKYDIDWHDLVHAPQVTWFFLSLLSF